MNEAYNDQDEDTVIGCPFFFFLLSADWIIYLVSKTMTIWNFLKIWEKTICVGVKIGKDASSANIFTTVVPII